MLYTLCVPTMFRSTKKFMVTTNPRKRYRYLVVFAMIIVVVICFITTLREYHKRNIIRTITKCKDTPREKRVEHHGNYFIFYNFIEATEQFKCDQSVTYATYSEAGQLKNLEAIVSIFDGPISIAVYTPRNDFLATLDEIALLRNCRNPKIRELVTFHLFFDTGNVPKKVCMSLFLWNKTRRLKYFV